MGGSGGSGGRGGAGGDGGDTGGAGGALAIAPGNMIDDLDDADDAILPLGGRAGYWFAYNDMTPGGQMKPAPDGDFLPEACGPSGKGHCVHVTGTGFRDWGAGVGFYLNAPGIGAAAPRPYDASRHRGIAFWARGNVPVRLSIPVAGVFPVEEGGTCVWPADPNSREQCHDTHGALVRLTPEWRQFVVPFADLRQAGFGKVVPWDSTKLMDVQFDVGRNLSFDISIDEIGFF